MIRYLEQLRQWQDRLKEEVDRRNANRPEHAISMVANKRIISGLRQASAASCLPQRSHWAVFTLGVRLDWHGQDQCSRCLPRLSHASSWTAHTLTRFDVCPIQAAPDLHAVRLQGNGEGGRERQSQASCCGAQHRRGEARCRRSNCCAMLHDDAASSLGHANRATSCPFVALASCMPCFAGGGAQKFPCPGVSL